MSRIDRKNRARVMEEGRTRGEQKNMEVDIKRLVLWVPLSEQSRLIDMRGYLETQLIKAIKLSKVIEREGRVHSN